MARIDAMIGGAHKAGTTSLARYLESLPSVISHPAKEFGYFAHSYASESFDVAYERAFDGEPGPGQLCLAKSVAILYSRSAAQRLCEHNPDVKLMVMLRDPVERAYSAYWYEVAQGRQDPSESFTDAIAKSEDDLFVGGDIVAHTAYVARGLYANLLATLHTVFDSSQIKVTILEEFKESPHAHMEAICEWLGIEYEITEAIGTRFNQGGHARSPKLSRLMRASLPSSLRKHLSASQVERVKAVLGRLNSSQTSVPPLDGAARAMLVERFREPNQQLRELLDQPIESWSS